MWVSKFILLGVHWDSQTRIYMSFLSLGKSQAIISSLWGLEFQMIPYGGIFDGLPWVPQVLFTFHHSLFLLLILNSWIVLSLGSLILSSGYSDLLLNLSGESLHFSYWTSQFQNSFPSFNRILRMVWGSRKSWVEITEKSHILLIPTQAQPPSLPASCTKVAHRYINTSFSPKLQFTSGFTLGAADKCIMTCTHNDSITQKSLMALYSPLCSNFLSPSPQPLTTTDLSSVSRM